jgi:hypothetical protein
MGVSCMSGLSFSKRHNEKQNNFVCLALSIMPLFTHIIIGATDWGRRRELQGKSSS